MPKFKLAVISAAIAVAVATMPMAPASAHGYRGPFFWGAVGAAVVGAAALVTLPLRVVAAPFAAPAYYPPPAPYYAPPPAYYAAPPAYAYPPGYYAPR